MSRFSPAQMKFIDAIGAISELFAEEVGKALDEMVATTEPDSMVGQIAGAANVSMVTVAALRDYTRAFKDVKKENAL